MLLEWKQFPLANFFGYRQKNGWDGDSLQISELLRNSEYYPYYLFAKINYAQVCLYEGNTDKIPVIFDGKFDLSLIYPERTRYHVSEFTGFACVMCAYFASIGKTDTAHLFYKSLLKLAPNERSTRFAASFLFPSVMSKLKRLIRS